MACPLVERVFGGWQCSGAGSPKGTGDIDGQTVRANSGIRHSFSDIAKSTEGASTSVEVTVAFRETQAISRNAKNRPISAAVARKLIRFSVLCSACRILIRFGGIGPQWARAGSDALNRR